MGGQPGGPAVPANVVDSVEFPPQTPIDARFSGEPVDTTRATDVAVGIVTAVVFREPHPNARVTTPWAGQDVVSLQEQ